MQCYLMKAGHIVLIKELPTDLSDEEAVEQCRLAFEGGRERADDFEVWRGARNVYRHSLDRGVFAFSSKQAVWP
jgi:hypothetical protein